MRIAVTGAKGLLGWHTASRIHAANCAARFRGEPPPYDLVEIDRALFSEPAALASALAGTSAILHFAGVNRGNDDDVEAANPALASTLIDACKAAGATPHIVYANSTHASRDTPYGRSKRRAGEVLSDHASSYTDLVLPHIFGECARPHYNNVTATLIDHLWQGTEPSLDPAGRVSLLHAGDAADQAIAAAVSRTPGIIAPAGQAISVGGLYAKLQGFYELYRSNIFPNLSDPFDLTLFNSLRAGAYPSHYPFSLDLREDRRGRLFETAKGGNASHTFLSTTKPGEVRGNHFHLSLVERFVVVRGEAVIRIRKILTDDVHEFRVTGDRPVAIDQIPLHTHNIENLGDEDVITFFWTHRMFDSAAPDTFAEPV